MRRPHPAVLAFGALVLGVIVLAKAYVWPVYKVFWSFDNLERNAKRVIDGAQLQEWAIGLLPYASSNNYPTVTDLGTNFPAQLLPLYRHPPFIRIYEGDTNVPAHVMLMWGGGMIGHCGFEIGPTNFESYRANARAWQPGVYFWSDFPPK